MFKSTRCHQKRKIFENPLWQDVYREPAQVLFDRMNTHKDHLGNIRLKYTQDPGTGQTEILEENHYYPFGLTHKGYNHKHLIFWESPGTGIQLVPVTPDLTDTYKYKFGGKEWQNELDLNYYDFGARNYDAALGRWMNVDPLGEIYMKTSPYAFTANNPIYNREIDGRYFEGKDEKRAERMEKKAEKKADKLEKKADKMENKGKDSGDLRDRAEELRQSAQDVRDMRSDENTQYRYSSTNSKEAKSLGLNGKPATVGTGTNDKGHNVVTMFTSSKMENKLHETRHGGQHMRGEINAITQKSSVNAEVSAYRAGYSWKGTMQYMTHNFDQTNILSRVILNTQGVVPGTIITINSINQINANMVLDIGEFHTHETMGTWVLPLYQKD